MTFVHRVLEVTFSLTAPTSATPNQPRAFAGSNSNTMTLGGLRMEARVSHAGGPSDGALDLVVFGMSKAHMDQLSTLGMQLNLVPNNQIVLTASNDSNGQTVVFSGYILAAYADFNAQPDVAFHVSAKSILPQAVALTPVASFKGTLDVATFMASLAAQMGLQFENNGVTAKLSNAYFLGDLKSQMRKAADDAGIEATVINGTLVLTTKNGTRGGAVPLISPSTGMIGYPTYNGYGILVRSIFNPSVGMNGMVQVQSSLKPACGLFKVYGIDYLLESEKPKGKWEMSLSCYNPKLPTPLVR